MHSYELVLFFDFNVHLTKRKKGDKGDTFYRKRNLFYLRLPAGIATFKYLKNRDKNKKLSRKGTRQNVSSESTS